MSFTVENALRLQYYCSYNLESGAGVSLRLIMGFSWCIKISEVKVIGQKL